MQPSVDLPYLIRTVKGTQYAYTRLPDGSRPSLGRAGSPESWHRLAALRQELEGVQRPLPSPTHDEVLTVAELAEHYIRAEVVRCDEGGISRTSLLLKRSVVHTLIEDHASLLVSEFGPKALKSVQERLRRTRCRSDSGRHRGDADPPTLSTSEINRRINAIRGIFRWGVSEELVPPTTLQALETVRGLRRGDGRETPDRTAVPIEDVEAVLHCIRADAAAPTVSDPVHARNLSAQADALEFLRWTGCRPSEACSLRVSDLRLEESPPVAILRQHKTRAATGKPRVIPLNANALRLVKRNRPNAHTPDSDPAIFQWTKGAVSRPLTPNGLYQLVRRYCKKASITHWSPYQIRHLVASFVVNTSGSEATAAALLGHTPNSRVVQRYSKDRLTLAQTAAQTLETATRRRP